MPPTNTPRNYIVDMRQRTNGVVFYVPMAESREGVVNAVLAHPVAGQYALNEHEVRAQIWDESQGSIVIKEDADRNGQLVTL